MVTEAHVKLRRTGSGKARTDSGAAAKPVHDVVANSQDPGPRNRAGAGRGVRRRRGIWPLAQGQGLAQWNIASLLAACILAGAVYLAFMLWSDRFGGALLLICNTISS